MNIKQGDISETQPDPEEEDMTEFRSDITQVDIVQVDIAEQATV